MPWSPGEGGAVSCGGEAGGFPFGSPSPLPGGGSGHPRGAVPPRLYGLYFLIIVIIIL